MERKKLVYNAFRDLWAIVSQDFANKSIVDMEDNDWAELINAIDTSAKKYRKLRPEETAFYEEITYAFMNLVEREIKTEVEVENRYPSPTTRIWVDSEKAKSYGLDIPKREPNK